MAQPTMHHEHYVERDTGSGAGVWAVVAVLIVLLALLLFGSNLFGGGGGGATDTGTNVDIRGNIDTGAPNTGGAGAGGSTAQ